MRELKRSDRQYVEVEEFADYELTQCVSYEMAARNPHYKKLADGVVAFYHRNKQSINDYVREKKHGDDYTFEQYQKNSKIFSELCDLVLEIDVIKEIEGYIILSKNRYKDFRLGDEFWDIVGICSSEFSPNEEKLEHGKGILVHQKDVEEIQLTKEINREGYSIDIALTSYDDDSYVPTDDDSPEDCGEIRTIEDYAKFIEEEGYLSRSHIKIEENFKRPLVNVDELKTIKPEITLNLNRPLIELLAYITHVKQDIEQNNLAKLPIELLGTELKRGDNLVCNDKGKKCFDPRSILSKQQKMADMFYIYDCLKEGYSQTKIRNEVYNYYADKGLNITLDPATLRKYRDVAMEYIVNGKYREMLTGVSIDELDYRFG